MRSMTFRLVGGGPGMTSVTACVSPGTLLILHPRAEPRRVGYDGSGYDVGLAPIAMLAGHRDRIGIATHADAVAPAARLAPPRNIRVPPLLPAAPVHGYTSCRVGATIVLPSTRASYAPKRIPPRSEGRRVG